MKSCKVTSAGTSKEEACQTCQTYKNGAVSNQLTVLSREGGVCGDNVSRKYKESRILCEPHCLKCFHITCHPLKREVHRKKSFSIFPYPDGMSLTKLSLGGNNDAYINYSRLGRVWYVTSRLGTGISKSFFTLCKYDLTFSSF